MAIWFTAAWWDEKRLEALKKERDRAASRVDLLLKSYHQKQDFKGCSELCRARKLNLLTAIVNHKNICSEIAQIELERKTHTS